MDFSKNHPLNDVTRTVQLRKCWWVYFDVNGNAPSDADVVACATKELAEEVLEWFTSMKNNEREPVIVLDGKRYSGLTSLSVEGYNFDTYYSVKEGEAGDGCIWTSLADVVKNSGIFDYEEDTTEKDEIYYASSETEEDNEE